MGEGFAAVALLLETPRENDKTQAYGYPVSALRCHRTTLVVVATEEERSSLATAPPRQVLVGVAWTDRKGRLMDIAVAPEATGRGVAARLVRRVAEINCAEQALELHCRARNDPALALYEQLGFRDQSGASSPTVTPVSSLDAHGWHGGVRLSAKPADIIKASDRRLARA